MEKEKVKTRHEMAEEMADKHCNMSMEGHTWYRRASFIAGWEAADAHTMEHMYNEMEQLKKKLAMHKEAISEKLSDEQGYCQEYTGIVILKEKLAAAEERQKKLIEALEKYMLAFKTVEAQLTLNPGLLGVWQRQFETILGDAPKVLAEHRKALEEK